jgi:hypothetical protein
MRKRNTSSPFLPLLHIHSFFLSNKHTHTHTHTQRHAVPTHLIVSFFGPHTEPQADHNAVHLLVLRNAAAVGVEEEGEEGVLHAQPIHCAVEVRGAEQSRVDRVIVTLRRFLVRWEMRPVIQLRRPQMEEREVILVYERERERERKRERERERKREELANSASIDSHW